MLDLEEALAEMFGSEAPRAIADMPYGSFSVKGGREMDRVTRQWRSRMRRARERRIDRELRLLRKSTCAVCFKPATRYVGIGVHLCADHPLP